MIDAYVASSSPGGATGCKVAVYDRRLLRRWGVQNVHEKLMMGHVKLLALSPLDRLHTTSK